MQFFAPYLMTGMAVVAFGCMSDAPDTHEWREARKLYKTHPGIVMGALGIAVFFAVAFWPWALWIIIKGRRR
jgi:hypothetical protein